MKTLENELVRFFHRVNDAFISSQTIHDLVNDSEYQRLLIKNGRAKGMSLGNKHLLPGFWYSVFVAPYESFHRVLAIINTTDNNEFNNNSNADIQEVADKFIKKTIKHPLHDSVNAFRLKMELLISNITWLKDVSHDTYPNSKPLRRFSAAIATGNYEFLENEDDLTCLFEDNDLLCGYTFQSKVKVAQFNQLAIDFTKELVAHLKEFVESNKTMKKELATMFIGESLNEIF